MRTRRVTLVSTIVLLLATTGEQRPTARQGAAPPKLFQTRVDVVSVTATVTDLDGHLVSDLPRDMFEIYEDGERQTITQFTSARIPIGIGALIDISDSMFGKRIADARSAVDQFLLELLTPSDEFFVLAFNHRPHLLTGWTREATEVRRALEAIRPSGGTAVYDAIVDALPLAAERTLERTALVIISDGADTASSATLRDLRTSLLRSDVLVYAIGIDPPERQAINTRVNAGALREITAESGGRTEVVQNSADIAKATAGIAEELNHQYVLGYTSTRAADGKFHSIRVRLVGTDGRVRARNGYVAAHY